MIQRRERLKPYIANALDTYIRRPPDDDSPEALADYQRRMKAMDEINQDRRTRTVRMNSTYRALDDFTYMGLSSILRTANLDLRGMYRLIGVELTFPNEEFAEVATICERLDDAQLSYVLDIASLLTVDFKADPIMNGPSATQAALSVYKLKRPPGKMFENHCKPIDRLFTNSECMTIDIIDFPEVSKYLGVSLHWLFRLANDVSAYGLKSMTEMVLDLFGFMPTRSQELFLCFLRNSKKEV